jgi:adenine-specific DNA-methyltransferase
MGRNGGTRLELTWIGKNDRPRLEPRILIEDAEKSYHAAAKRDGDIFDNVLIQGDNLLALKALEADYAGKVKCVFIDPPYNTGSAFEHYDDGVEHSLWLSLMRDRLELIRRLLSEDGSLWITIDDNEAHYLKVLCDGIFGRQNFISNVIWQKNFSPKSSARHFSASHDHILIYARSSEIWERNLQPRSGFQDDRYKNPDNDPRGVWISDQLTARNPYSRGLYPVVCPSGRNIDGPPKGRYWAISPERFKELDEDHRIWWGADGNNMPRLKRFLSEVQQGVVPQTIWTHNEVGHTQEAKKEVLPYADETDGVFQTPKPERLLSRVLEIATKPGDLVLDSFAGSGTTGAVAHKMGRRWIMVELGDHAVTHVVPRLKKVIDGQDQGGVTEATGWQGGGGFRFYHLAPSLLEKDKWGNWVIAKTYNTAMLAEAMCRHMGFAYAPSQDVAEYWKHGHSSERDFIFITTASLTHDQLKAISHDVGPDRTLLICCKAFNARVGDFENLTIKKIPHAILNRCEWGRDDYSLEIADLPSSEPDNGNTENNGKGDAPKDRKRGRGKATDSQPTLFSEGEA